jgi:hypothetical protein
MWFYSIRGSGNRAVKQSEAIYNSEQEALRAGKQFLQNNKPSLVGPDDPHEVFSLTTGRK